MKLSEPTGGMRLTSLAFTEGQTLRRTYTGDGADVSPALQWSVAPVGVRSFAVTCRDIDAPGGPFTHWVIYNIPGDARELPEGLPAQEKLSDCSIQGLNGFQRTGYSGPKPPPGGSHKYHFDLYALDTVLPVEGGVTAARLQELMRDHIVAKTTLMGTYRR
jgi:Raf kinase inhibitor-like YbhB/YbcL family protein